MFNSIMSASTFGTLLFESEFRTKNAPNNSSDRCEATKWSTWCNFYRNMTKWCGYFYCTLKWNALQLSIQIALRYHIHWQWWESKVNSGKRRTNTHRNPSNLSIYFWFFFFLECRHTVFALSLLSATKIIQTHQIDLFDAHKVEASFFPASACYHF